MPHHVFLSYSRKDTALMQRIRDDLRAHQITVWTDEALTPGTDSWNREIEEAIHETKCVVVILSPDSKQSEWVSRELAYARSRQPAHRIFPVLARGSETDAVPIELIRTQRIDFRTDYPAAIQQLVDSINKHLNDLANPPPKIKSQPLDQTDTTNALTLSIWNPSDYFKLLWWLFIQPKQFQNRRYQITTQLKQMGAWLGSTLIWLPLFIPVIGKSLGLVVQYALPPLNISFPDWCIIVILAWIITGLFGNLGEKTMNRMAVMLMGGVLLIVAFVIERNFMVVVGLIATLGIAGGITLVLTGAEPRSMGVGLISGVANVLNKNLATQRSSFLSKLIFIFLIFSYIALIYIYWFGGWRYIA